VVGGGRGGAFFVGLGVGDNGGVSPGKLGGRVIPGGTIGVIPAIGLRMSGGGKLPPRHLDATGVFEIHAILSIDKVRGA